MSSKARVEFDPRAFGLRIAVQRDHGTRREMLHWQPVTVEAVTRASTAMDESAWLQLPEDDARAIYEALGDHFGHAGHDVRALRRDYDDERKRVDRLIGAVVGGRR